MSRKKMSEKVMVVHSDDIFGKYDWEGLHPNFMEILDLARIKHRFLPRDEVENNREWQQIIPFGVFVSQKHIFSYVKASGSSEKRLVGKRIIGVGGHLNQSDLVDYGSLLQWFEREWREEVRYEGSPFVWPLGVIHETTNPVSQCHLGFAFLLYGTKMSIAINAEEELMEAKFLTLDELCGEYAGVYNWNTIVLEHIKKNRKLLAL